MKTNEDRRAHVHDNRSLSLLSLLRFFAIQGFGLGRNEDSEGSEMKSKEAEACPGSSEGSEVKSNEAEVCMFLTAWRF